MSEITGLFGPTRGLVGTLAIPTAAAAQPVGFILLNAGVIHRIGPHRLNVKLARALEVRGFASLRFDLSGQGDSLAATDATGVLEQGVADVRAAVNHLERTVGVRQFVIVGFCSGAHHAISTAKVDQRITGLWMYDSFIYSTPKARRVAYLRRLRVGGIAGVFRWLSRQVRRPLRSRGPHGGNAERLVTDEYWQAAPPRKAYGKSLQQLTDRGVRIATTYSGGFLDEYSYATQFRDAFSDFEMSRIVESTFRPKIDHTITAIDAQLEVITAVCDWADSFSSEQRAQVVGNLQTIPSSGLRKTP